MKQNEKWFQKKQRHMNTKEEYRKKAEGSPKERAKTDRDRSLCVGARVQKRQKSTSRSHTINCTCGRIIERAKAHGRVMEVHYHVVKVMRSRERLFGP